MSKEKDITKNITRVVKAGDKLLQDIERDVGQVIVAVNAVKEVISDIKNKFKGPDDKKEV